MKSLWLDIFFFNVGFNLTFFICLLKAYSVGSIEKTLKFFISWSSNNLVKDNVLSPIFEPTSIILKKGKFFFVF